MIRRIQIQGFSALLLMTTALLLLTYFVHHADHLWIQGMILLAGLECLVGFLMISWAIRGSDRLFYSVYVGGVLARLILLGAAAYVLERFAVPLAAPLLTLVLTYFLASLLQVPFFLKLNLWISSKS